MKPEQPISGIDHALDLVGELNLSAVVVGVEALHVSHD
jgi:hypothetical protein